MNRKTSATINEQVLLEMAYPRAVFKNKLEEFIGGALGEFYKAECAKVNGFTKWVAHWSGEANRLLSYMATQVYLHPIRGFKDRRKALAEALAELQQVDGGYRNYAMNTVVRDYQVKKLKHPIPADSTRRFYALVEDHIQKVEQTPPLEE
jgi:hypothetical protein